MIWSAKWVDNCPKIGKIYAVYRDGVLVGNFGANDGLAAINAAKCSIGRKS